MVLVPVWGKLVELREAVGMTRKERILQEMIIYSLEWRVVI